MHAETAEQNYPLRDCRIYDLQVGNKYNIKMILHLNQLINTKLLKRISSILYTFKIQLLHILKKTLCMFLFFIYFILYNDQQMHA